MAVENKTWVLAERPQTSIVAGKTFRLEKAPAPTADDLKDGQVLLESLYMSLDPAMRGWLNDVRSYVPPVQIGEKMRGQTVSRVLASKSPKVKAGDFVSAWSGWTEYSIANDNAIELVEIPKGGKITDILNVLGGVGLTAWTGLQHVAKLKAGETVVVSGAAGGTGSIVGQIAKLRGCKVIGIAGSDDKCDFLVKELGFDAALNYKKETFKQDFVAATPEYLDVFWDNVGGEILDFALTRAKKGARFVMCGAISGYNGAGRDVGIKNLTQVIAQRIIMQGFIVLDYPQDFATARQEMGQWLAEGKLKAQETVIKGGLEVAETAIQKLFDGSNTGKLMVEIKALDQVRGAKL
ncbi:NAD(P)-binding protein [Xylaria sp. CBS 124048]|nr:NAD(P)-binding protein [Xylaria sp. CBS 124048]